MNNFKGKTIALACDHAGFERKQVIIKYLEEQGYKYHDFGCFSSESVDYPIYGHLIGEAFDKGEFEIAISLCGSGQGISMTANKHQSVRSAICWFADMAALTRKHNDSNVCALPARFVTDDEAIAIVDAFLNTDFEGGRHARRVKIIPIKK